MLGHFFTCWNICSMACSNSPLFVIYEYYCITVLYFTCESSSSLCWPATVSVARMVRPPRRVYTNNQRLRPTLLRNRTDATRRRGIQDIIIMLCCDWPTATLLRIRTEATPRHLVSGIQDIIIMLCCDWLTATLLGNRTDATRRHLIWWNTGHYYNPVLWLADCHIAQEQNRRHLPPSNLVEYRTLL